MIPHPEKLHKGGEDAYFTNDQLLSVADGVNLLFFYFSLGRRLGLIWRRPWKVQQTILQKCRLAGLRKPLQILNQTQTINHRLA